MLPTLERETETVMAVVLRTHPVTEWYSGVERHHPSGDTSNRFNKMPVGVVVCYMPVRHHAAVAEASGEDVVQIAAHFLGNVPCK